MRICVFVLFSLLFAAFEAWSQPDAPTNVRLKILEPVVPADMVNAAADGTIDNEFPKAFPGALGGGKFASGGRGGVVVKVNTRTNDCNSGNNLVSLNEALTMTVPRYIVFEVDGIIDLGDCTNVRPSSMRPLYLRSENSNVTVACQTAPGKMVIRLSQITHNNGMSNAIYRHCAFFGDRVTGGGSRGGQRVVGIAAQNADSENFMFDHLSMMWSDDDNFQVFITQNANAADARNITVQHSISAEGDADSAADNSSDCNGTSTASNCSTRGQANNLQSGGGAVLSSNPVHRGDNVTFTHNLKAHIAVRIYEIKGSASATVSNNITYNSQSYGAIWQNGYKNLKNQVVAKNNLFIRGPDTRNLSSNINYNAACNKEFGGYCPFFLTAPVHSEAGNIMGDNYYVSTVGGNPQTAGLIPQHPHANKGNISSSGLTPVPDQPDIRTLAAQGSAHIACIGASKPVRNSHDQRVINEMYSGTGAVGIKEDIRSNTNVVNKTTHDTVIQRDWSEFSNGSGHPVGYDTDNDGMEDAWEQSNGLNVGIRDHNGDIDNDGYTNLEEFLNFMARC